jgi:hypothetical protein
MQKTTPKHHQTTTIKPSPSNHHHQTITIKPSPSRHHQFIKLPAKGSSLSCNPMILPFCDLHSALEKLPSFRPASALK